MSVLLSHNMPYSCYIVFIVRRGRPSVVAPRLEISKEDFEMTTLTRFVPFRSSLADMTVLQNRLNSIFNDFAMPEGDRETLGMGNFIPPVDVYEDAQQLVL